MALYENLGKVTVSEPENTSDRLELTNVELGDTKTKVDKVLKRFF